MDKTTLEHKLRLIEYRDNKIEALRFWSDLRDVMHLEGKIKELNAEIAEATAQLQKLLRMEKSYG